MTRASLVLAISLIVASTAPRSAIASGNALPYVGTIQSIDFSGRSVVLLGPDDKELNLAMPKRFMIEGEGPALFAELEGKEGYPLGVFLKNPETARLPVLLPEKLDKPLKVYVGRVRTEQQVVELKTKHGFMQRLRPAVNLGATATLGEAPVRGSWDWFRANNKKPVYVRVVQITGMSFIWDVRPWDPKSDPDTSMDAEDDEEGAEPEGAETEAAETEAAESP